jgi:integrase
LKVKKQKSGLYRSSVVIGHDDEGKPIIKYISGKTLAELERHRQEIKRTYIGGEKIDTEKLVSAAAQDWFYSFKHGKVSPGARNRYVSIINNYIVPAIGSKRVTAVTRMDCQDILNKFEEKSVSYVKTAKSTLAGIFQLAVDDGIISRNPAGSLNAPRGSMAQEKRAFTPDERRAITAYAPRDISIALLYYTGMRSGEIRALRWQDIDLQKRLIHVERALGVHADDITPCKNATSRRTVPIVPQLMQILMKYRGLPHAPVLGEYFSIHQFSHHVLGVLDRLGIPDATAHCFRHNFITMCWESRMDFMLTSRIVGHAHPTITLDIYTHLDKTRAAADAVDQLAAMF